MLFDAEANFDNTGCSRSFCFPAVQTADIYLTRSISLYRVATRWPKQTYNRFVETSSTYPSASIYDDMAYAAAW